MSICICSRCDNQEDTDYHEGYWDDDGEYICDSCVIDLAIEEENNSKKPLTGTTEDVIVLKMKEAIKTFPNIEDKDLANIEHLIKIYFQEKGL